MPHERCLPSNDTAAAAHYGADPREVERHLEEFGHGGCRQFAGRLHEWTGWEVFKLPAGDHYAVLRPDGALVDVYGVFQARDGGWAHMAARYGRTEEDWEKIDPMQACFMEEQDRRKVDAFLKTAWGQAILPSAARRAYPIYYAELDMGAER